MVDTKSNPIKMIGSMKGLLIAMVCAICLSFGVVAVNVNQAFADDTVLTVHEQTTDGKIVAEYKMTQADLNAAKQGARTTQYLSYYKSGWQVQKYTDYVTVAEIASALKINLYDTDVLAFNLEGKAAQVSWKNAKAGMFYPNATLANGAVSNWGQGVSTPALVGLAGYMNKTRSDDLNNILGLLDSANRDINKTTDISAPVGAFGAVPDADIVGGNRAWTDITDLYIVEATPRISSVTIASTSMKYAGKALMPAITSVKAGNLAVPATDYTVSYANNNKLGTATVTVTGKGNFAGSASATFTIKAAKNSVFTIGGIKYKVTKENSELAVTGTTKTKGAITIPATAKVGGKALKVTSIADKAFQGKKITSLTIGTNVKKIGKSAFAKCKKLKTLNIKSKSVTTFGKSMVSGSYAKMKIKAPAAKVKAYKTKIAKTGGFKKTMKVTK